MSVLTRLSPVGRCPLVEVPLYKLHVGVQSTDSCQLLAWFALFLCLSVYSSQLHVTWSIYMYIVTIAWTSYYMYMFMYIFSISKVEFWDPIILCCLHKFDNMWTISCDSFFDSVCTHLLAIAYGKLASIPAVRCSVKTIHVSCIIAHAHTHVHLHEYTLCMLIIAAICIWTCMFCGI